MSSMDFGLCIPCFANPGAAFFRTPRWSVLDPKAAVEAGVQAERLGYDSLWMADHFIHGVDGGILEGWTTLSVLAGRTNRIQLGTIHMSDAFRQPSLTAKMTSTLDALSGGRFIFFFDAGWGLDEQRAYGYPDRPASERLERLGESLDLITQLWSGATVNYAGKHFHTNDAVCLPKPVRVPPIWLGEVRDDAYLDIIGRYADGWNSVPVSPRQFGERWAKVASACTRAGRDPDTLTRSLEIQILIAPTRSAVRQILEECAALPTSPRIPANATIVNYLKSSPADAPPLPEDVASHWLIGTPDEVHSQLEAYAREGVSHLMLWFADFPSHDGMRLFADEVMPRWRS